MCRDIELHWGEPVESTRKLLQTELEIMKGYEEISLHNYYYESCEGVDQTDYSVYVSSSNTYHTKRVSC